LHFLAKKNQKFVVVVVAVAIVVVVANAFI
jgi:hypothetical protein